MLILGGRGLIRALHRRLARRAAEQKLDEAAAEIGPARIGVALRAARRGGRRLDRDIVGRAGRRGAFIAAEAVGGDAQGIGAGGKVECADEERGEEDTPHC